MVFRKWQKKTIMTDQTKCAFVCKSDLVNYQSLSHINNMFHVSVCHSFTPNACFQQLWHPRFGLIMSVRARTDIQQGEEILVSYNYSIGQAPDWYRHAWFSHLRDNQHWSEEKIQVTASAGVI